MTALAEGKAAGAATRERDLPEVAGSARPLRYLIAAVCVFVITVMLAPIALSFLASIKPA